MMIIVKTVSVCVCVNVCVHLLIISRWRVFFHVTNILNIELSLECVHVCMHASMCVCVCTHVCVCVHMHMYVCVCVFCRRTESRRQPSDTSMPWKNFPVTGSGKKAGHSMSSNSIFISTYLAASVNRLYVDIESVNVGTVQFEGNFWLVFIRILTRKHFLCKNVGITKTYLCSNGISKFKWYQLLLWEASSRKALSASVIRGDILGIWVLQSFFSSALVFTRLDTSVISLMCACVCVRVSACGCVSVGVCVWVGRWVCVCMLLFMFFLFFLWWLCIGVCVCMRAPFNFFFLWWLCICVCVWGEGGGGGIPCLLC